MMMKRNGTGRGRGQENVGGGRGAWLQHTEGRQHRGGGGDENDEREAKVEARGAWLEQRGGRQHRGGRGGQNNGREAKVEGRGTWLEH